MVVPGPYIEEQSKSYWEGRVCGRNFVKEKWRLGLGGCII